MLAERMFDRFRKIPSDEIVRRRFVWLRAPIEGDRAETMAVYERADARLRAVMRPPAPEASGGAPGEPLSMEDKMPPRPARNRDRVGAG